MSTNLNARGFTLQEKELLSCLEHEELITWSAYRAFHIQSLADCNSVAVKKRKTISLQDFRLIVMSFFQVLYVSFSKINTKNIVLLNERTMISNDGKGWFDEDYLDKNDDSFYFILPDIESPIRKTKLYTKRYVRLDFLLVLETVFTKVWRKPRSDRSALARFEISKGVEQYIPKSKIRFKIFNLLLSRFKFERLYLKSNYSPIQNIFSSAVRYMNSNADVIEVQHSFIYNYHPGYFLPESDLDCRKINFPDYIECYDEQSKFNLISMGWDSDRIVKKINFEKTYENKHSNDILIVSQFPVIKDLVSFIMTTSGKRNIRIKLHPRNVIEQKIAYSKVVEQLDHVSIVDESINIDDCVNECDLIIGSYSTVLYDAMKGGKKVIVINSKGKEVFSEFIIKGQMSYYDEKSHGEIDL